MSSCQESGKSCDRDRLKRLSDVKTAVPDVKTTGCRAFLIHETFVKSNFLNFTKSEIKRKNDYNLIKFKNRYV